jgi:hypothetical protein
MIRRKAPAYWVPRLRRGRQGWKPQPPPYTFFTSLTLEKVMPSARSRV